VIGTGFYPFTTFLSERRIIPMKVVSHAANAIQRKKSGMIGEEIQAGRVRESPGCGGGTSLKGTPSTNIRTVADTGGA
jgi:hypothetical protein